MSYFGAFAKKEFEFNGKWWAVTVENCNFYFPERPVDLVYAVYKKSKYGGWVHLTSREYDKLPKAVGWAGTCLLEGYRAGMAAMGEYKEVA